MNSTEKKIKDRCDIFEKIIFSISDIYWSDKTNDDQRKFIETTLGAGVFYLPSHQKHWTGQISKKLLESLTKKLKKKLTKEHEFPRKLAAKEILTKIKNKELVDVFELYDKKYSRFNYVTSKENKKLSKYQKEGVFVSIENAYKISGIKLIDISIDELKKLKKIKKN